MMKKPLTFWSRCSLPVPVLSVPSRKRLPNGRVKRRLANLYKNIPGTAYQFRIDKAGDYHFDYIGDNCAGLFGVGAKDALANAHAIFGRIPQPDVEKVHRAIERSAASLTQYNIEHRIIRGDGETLWIHASAIPRRLNDGCIVWDGIGLNITEKKRIEEDLKESEERYRALFLQNPNPIAIIDTKGNFLDANETYVDFVETPREKLLTMNAFDYSPKRKKAKQLGEHEPVWKYGGTLETEYFVNGNIKLLELHISPICYRGIDAVIGVGKDITEQKRAENALRESEEKYRSMMESMSDATHICSSDLRVEYMNPAMRERVGKDLTGELCHVAIHGLDERCSWCAHDRIMKGESIKSELKTDAGEVFFVSRSPVFHTNGTVSQLSVYRDITEMRKLERRVHQAQKMESIGNLAGGIAHDFNNILFPIIGMSELLLDDLPLQGLQRENVEEILKAGKRGRDLVNQILAFSRQSEKKLMPIRVQSVLKEVLHLVRATIPSYVDIRQDIQTDTGMVMADPSQIHQVAMNIMTNAYHALAAGGGEIAVGLKEAPLGDPEAQEINLDPGSYVCLSISDTGRGISADHIGRIFDPYFTTKEQGKGTGLGLAVAYGIVKEHSGEIKAKSGIGKGSTFDVYLPVIEKPERQETTDRTTPHAGGRERLLVVDDEEPIVKLEKKMLERLGYHVTTHANSLDALEAFKANPYSFDLIISDMSMPHMTGDEFAKEVKLIRREVPVIICTGFSERIDAAKARAIGVSGFLMKPFVQSEIAETVRSALDDRAVS